MIRNQVYLYCKPGFLTFSEFSETIQTKAENAQKQENIFKTW